MSINYVAEAAHDKEGGDTPSIRLTDSQLVEHASASSLLRGRKLDGKGGWTRCDRLLVGVPDSVQLTGPDIGDEVEEYEFYEASQFDRFMNSLMSTGRSMSAKLEAGIFRVNAFAGGDYVQVDEDARRSELHTKSKFYARSQIVFVPTAACNLQPNKLSKEAKEELRKIESQLRCLDLEGTETSIRAFMDSFGSHATSGTVHFGGILASEASYNCTESESLDTGKSLVCSALKAIVGVGMGDVVIGSGEWSGINTEGSQLQRDLNHQMNKVFKKVRKLGGPIEETSELLWRGGLARSNRQWHVIKYGVECVPVWDLIASEDFDNGARHLVQAFKAVWQKDHHIDPISVCAPSQFDKAIKSYNLFVAEFAKSAKETTCQWSKQLKELFETINTIEKLTAVSRRGTVWAENSDLEIVLDEFLRHSPELLQTPESPSIASYLQQLVDLSATCFPKKEQILSVLKPRAAELPYKLRSSGQTLTSPEQLVELVRNRYLPDMSAFIAVKASEDHEKVMRAMQPELVNEINKLLRTLTDAKQNYEKFLVVCVVISHGFQLSEGQFDHLLNYEAVQKLADAIESEINSMAVFTASNEVEFVQANLLFVYKKYIQVHVNDFDIRKQILNVCEYDWLLNIRTAIAEFIKSGCVDWTGIDSVTRTILQQYNKNGQKIPVDLGPLARCCEAQKTGSAKTFEATSLYEVLNYLDLSAIKALGLQDFWPGKLSMSTVMSLSSESDSDVKDSFGLRMLKLLAMTNYNCRESTIIRFKSHEQLDSRDEEDDWSDDYNPQADTRADAANTSLHFCDVLMVCFLSANPMLRQTISEKLFDCKLAVPILYSVGGKKLLFTWTLRSLVLKFVPQNQSQPGSSVELILNSGDFPVVSVIRLGTSSFSKSKIANTFLNKKHDTFTVSGKSSLKKLHSDGSIELAWMLPAAADKSGHQSAICLLNLRGDAGAEELSEQLDFLASVSTYLVVMLPDEDCSHSDAFSQVLVRLYSSKSRLGLLVSSEQIPKCLRDLEQTFSSRDERKNLDLIRLKKPATAMEDVEIANTLLQKMLKTGFLERKLASLAKFCDFGRQKSNWILEDSVDHVRESIDAARRLVEKVRTPNTSENLAVVKQTNLPLHGNPCLEISKRKKQRFRLNRSLVGEEKTRWVGEIDAEISQLRQEQASLLQSQVNEKDNFILNFLTSLQSFSFDPIEAEVFLRHLAIELNSLSLVNLAAIRRSFHCLWGDISREKNATLDQKRQFEKADVELQGASFGLEHILREVAQVYEAIMCNVALKEKYQNLAQSLARVAAQLLLQGHALEIIDGDITFVADLWIQAVLKQVESIIGAKHLLVVSILGIQSSGKSTLLNTMFGLQFPASAGRCTRGAFMQLVKNQPEKSGVNVDYVVVIDTEGLRAPELGGSTKEHDNEVATMVIGLADVALINIMGEGLSEISDVLQIAVHALIRMKMAFKSVILEKSCIFLHQNVAAVDASDKLRTAGNVLLQELNRAVAAAAREEGANDVGQFTDIISFDPNTDVCFWPNLWEGTPPNAPVNPDYSRMAQKTRIAVLKQLKRFENSKLSFSNLAIRICDLWDAVLREDFVFSFQNTLELNAYREVEREFLKICFTLESSVTDWVKSEGVLKVRQCNEVNLLETILNVTQKLLSSNVEEAEAVALQKLEIFLAGHELKHISNKWEQDKKISLSYCARRILETCTNLLRGITEEQRSALLNRTKMADYQNRILTETRKLAESQNRTQLTPDQKKLLFEDMWNQFINEVIGVETVPWNAAAEAERAVREAFSDLPSSTLDENVRCFSGAKKDAKFFNFKLQGSFQESFVLDSHFTYTKSIELFRKAKSSSDCAQVLVLVADSALSKIDSLMKERENSKERHIVSKTDFQNFIILVRREITEYNEKGLNSGEVPKTPKIKTNPGFELALAIHACKYALAIFEAWHHQYEEKHGIAAKVRDFKDLASKTFSNRLQRETEEVIAADAFAATIKVAINRQVKEQKSLMVLKSLYGDFDLTKLHLITLIMESLADNGNFEDFIDYIEDSKAFALKWLTRYVQAKIFSKTPRQTIHYNELIEELTRPQVEAVKESVHEASASLLDELSRSPAANTLFQEWIKIFCNGSKLGWHTENFSHIDANSISDVKNFEELLLRRLETMKSELLTEHSISGATEIEWVGESPAESLLQRLWGCPEQCPFCDEPCSNSSEGHQSTHWNHVCLQHRPAGVTGTRVNQYRNELALTSCNFDVQTMANFNCGAVNYRCRQSGKCQSGGPDSKSLKFIFHEYEDFKTVFPDWQISPDASDSSSPYWMWFMNQFSENLQRHYGCCKLDLPVSWRHISKEQAKESLSKYSPSSRPT